MRKKGPVSVILVMAMLVVANLTFHPLASASPSDALLDDEAPIDVFLEGDRPLQEMRENAEGESVRSLPRAVETSDDTRSADLRAPAAWADGRIKVTVSTVNLGKTRNDWQYPRAGAPAWITCSSYNAGGVELLDSNSALVGSFSGASAYEFVGLEEGTYTLKLTYDSDALVVLKNIANGSEPMQNIVRDAVMQIVVTQEKPTHTYHVVYEPKAYGFKTTTAIGTFQSGGNERVYYKGENLQVPNTDPVSSSYVPFLNSHNGIYYGDSPNQYTGMNTLEIPMLSDSEKRKGYSFAGWRLRGDTSGKVYSTDDALAYVVRGDTAFEAVWTYPTHVVTFSTDADYGKIDGKESYSYTVDYDDQFLPVIPKVAPKEGYEFVGWFTDLSTNIVSNDLLASTVVDRDLSFYAKYKRTTTTNTVKYLAGTGGALTGRDFLTIVSGGFIPTIPSVTPNAGQEFGGHWKVVSMNPEAGQDIAVGDVLNEVQISRLQINYDVVFEALYGTPPLSSSDCGRTASLREGRDPASVISDSVWSRGRPVPQTSDGAKAGFLAPILAVSLAVGSLALQRTMRSRAKR